MACKEPNITLLQTDYLDIRQLWYTLAPHSQREGTWSPFHNLAKEIEAAAVIKFINTSLCFIQSSFLNQHNKSIGGGGGITCNIEDAWVCSRNLFLRVCKRIKKSRFAFQFPFDFFLCSVILYFLYLLCIISYA